jgi:3-(3-hydroxy-phenyl)propionate hydroxylase
LEFMLRPGETAADVSRPETIAALVEPYLDPTHLTVTRTAVYTFHHLVAQRWRAGRVFLLGDAAHQMPPFMGQGLCSGLRDAANLSWKLAMVLSGTADPALLDTYEIERRPHTEEMAKTSVRMGRVFLARSQSAAWLRDTALRTVQTVPRVRRFLRHFEFKPVPAHRRGLMAGGRRDGAVGTMFPQPRVISSGSPKPHLLDDALGSGFTMIGLGSSASMLDEPSWRGLPVRVAAVHPAGVAPESLSMPALGHDQADHVDLIDVDGAIIGWLRRHRADVVILRPDRFVFATGATGEIGRLAQTLAAALVSPALAGAGMGPPERVGVVPAAGPGPRPRWSGTATSTGRSSPAGEPLPRSPRPRHNPKR